MSAPRFGVAKKYVCVCDYCKKEFRATKPNAKNCYSDPCMRAMRTKLANRHKQRLLDRWGDKNETLKVIRKNFSQGWFTSKESGIPLKILQDMACEGMIQASKMSRCFNVYFRV